MGGGEQKNDQNCMSATGDTTGDFQGERPLLFSRGQLVRGFALWTIRGLADIASIPG